MKSLATIKSEESAKLAADYADWLRSGGKTVILPGPGDGHRLTDTFSLRQKSDAEYAKNGKFKGETKC